MSPILYHYSRARAKMHIASVMEYLHPRMIEHFCQSSQDVQLHVPEGDPNAIRLINYRVQKSLIGGSTSQVKLAQDLRTGTSVCMKFMPKKLNSRRFVSNEVSIMQHLRAESEHVCKTDSPLLILHGMCETRKEYVLIFDYMEGGDLFERISKQGRLSNGAAIFRQVARAVQLCHEAGIAHCDIKPENILLDGSGNVKLADYGLAQRMTPGVLSSVPCGSMNYMAPEVLSMKPYDVEKADMWSLGIVLYSLMTGYLPEGDGSRDDPTSPAHVGVFAIADHAARDLAAQLLVTTPSRRLSIACVMKHPFVTQRDPSSECSSGGKRHKFRRVAKRTAQMSI